MGMLGRKLMVSKVFMVGMVLVDEMWMARCCWNLLEFADALDFAVVNTWFKKEVRKMITYETKACMKPKLVRRLLIM